MACGWTVKRAGFISGNQTQNQLFGLLQKGKTREIAEGMVEEMMNMIQKFN